MCECTLNEFDNFARRYYIGYHSLRGQYEYEFVTLLCRWQPC